MKPDERAVLEALAALVGIAGWASPWMISQNFDQPVHTRRLRHFIDKWDRNGYWSPVLSMSGAFTPQGWAWLESIGIRRGGPIPPEQFHYARWLREPDGPNKPPHVYRRDGTLCCSPPNWHHQAV